MYVQCDQCGKQYDDEHQWTLCPHAPLDLPPFGYYCPKCDIRRDVHGPCRHLLAEDRESERLADIYLNGTHEPVMLTPSELAEFMQRQRMRRIQSIVLCLTFALLAVAIALAAFRYYVRQL